MNITVSQVIDQAIRLCEQRPDHKYAGGLVGSCSYVPNERDVEGCLFGQALVKLGVSTDVLKEFEAQDDDGSIVTLLREWGLELDDRTDMYLMDAQRAQDDGKAWGTESLSHLLAAKAHLEAVQR